jgi:hypothetical protein
MSDAGVREAIASRFRDRNDAVADSREQSVRVKMQLGRSIGVVAVIGPRQRQRTAGERAQDMPIRRYKGSACKLYPIQFQH